MGMRLIDTSHTVRKAERGTQKLPKTRVKLACDKAFAEEQYNAWKKQNGL